MHRVFTAVLGMLCLSFPVLAGTIQGRVEDPLGNPVSGIRLLLLDSRGSTVSTATSDNRGSYQFSNSGTGKRVIYVRESGFQQQNIELQVEPGQNVHQDIVLKIEPLQQDVVVTATRTETSASLLGSSVTAITNGELEVRHAASATDLLRSVPSLNVHQVGGRGGLTSLFLRGGDSDYNKVLLDGIPLNQPGGAVDLSNLSAVNVDRIEVVRGPQSALYGSDAITSVVQIFTKKGNPEKHRPDVGFTFEGGNYSSFSGGADVAGGVGPLSYTAQFQHDDTENRVPNNFLHNDSFSSRIDLNTSSNSSLELLTRVQRSRSGVPGPTAFGPSDLDAYYRKRDFLTGLSWNQRVSDNWSQRVSYSQSYVNQLSEDPLASPSFVPAYEGLTATYPYYDFPYSFLNATRRHNLNYQSDWVLRTHLVTTGMDYEEERGTVGDVRAKRSNFGYYLQDQFVLRQRLSVTSGLRLEDNGSFGFAAVPRVSVACLLRRGNPDGLWGMTRPKFNFGLGIKEPNFIESFSQNRYFRGNPNLKPERTRSFEAGVEQQIWHQKIRTEVNFFRSRFADLISFQTTDFSTFEGSYFNLGRSQAWGVEHIVEVFPMQHLKVTGNYTYLNSKILKSTSSYDPVYREGERLLLRPTHSGHFGLTWLGRRWQLSSSAIVVGNRADSDFMGIGLMEAKGYVKLNLSGNYQINPRVSLYSTMDNLSNREYYEALGYPALKFNFRSGLRVRL